MPPFNPYLRKVNDVDRQEAMQVLVEALVLAVTAPMEEQAMKATGLAAEIASDLTEQDLRDAQAIVLRRIKMSEDEIEF